MIEPFDDQLPVLADDAFVASTAVLVGRVSVAAGASVWYGAVVRGDGARIEIGEGSNVQDGAVLHADPGLPLSVGAGVTVGHRAVLHGCTVEDDVLVGMSATVLNGARVGRGSIVAAGAVVLEGTDVPPGSLVAGVPAKVRRGLEPAELDRVRLNATGYVGLAAAYRAREGHVR